MGKSDTRAGWTIAAAFALLVPAVAGATDDTAGESDRFFMAEAEGACRNGDFPAFLWPFANSRAVRERYSAPAIRSGAPTTARELPANRYLAADDFPVVMIDYSYVTGASARRFDAPGGGDPHELVYVQVDFSTPSEGVERVDWMPGRFEPGEGDGPGTLIEKTGAGGHLHFRRVADCWQLVEDIRNPEAGG
ncbi:hypothetical protein SAMN05428974_1224 [Sphingopyxis sp. YR583]|uniref:hypothetical protein n=1 Tax=Sphingopyxis sp. YR583 TaxID=1881047 RepID=UPI0008A7F6B0|nr:hypothetical protein [Sphingopyxis sp. YR583]SEH14589.1 hypothetical protein SAMN05428974_1224 [Sphingopyxis sp. YR583]